MPLLSSSSAGFFERAVDDLLERGRRLRPAQEVAVDDESRRSVHAGVVADLHVGVDFGLVLARIEGGLELFHVEADLGRNRLETLAPDALLLTFEGLVVELPEARVALLRERFLRRFGGEGSILVEWQRQVTPHELDLV